MSGLSRAENRRRPPLMTAGRWALLLGGFLLLACVSFVLYVKSADADYQTDEYRALYKAKQEAGLKTTKEAFKHVWDETVWVVEGTDAQGDDWFVWLRDDGIEKRKASEGLNREAVRARFREERPDGEIVRLLPGWFRGEPAWEVRYVADAFTDRQAIDFYSFEDGTRLKTYDLPGK